MTTKTYANKSNARRAAKAAGLDLATLLFFVDETGAWSWDEKQDETDLPEVVDTAPKAPRYKLHRKAKAKPAPVVAAPAPVAPAKAAAETPKHKDFQVYSRSSVLSPVQFVKGFLDKHGAELTRKEALFELNKAGVNYATARTQYQRWFAANK